MHRLRHRCGMFDGNRLRSMAALRKRFQGSFRVAESSNADLQLNWFCGALHPVYDISALLMSLRFRAEVLFRFSGDLAVSGFTECLQVFNNLVDGRQLLHMFSFNLSTGGILQRYGCLKENFRSGAFFGEWERCKSSSSIS